MLNNYFKTETGRHPALSEADGRLGNVKVIQLGLFPAVA
jgi:hypothetical protein